MKPKNRDFRKELARMSQEFKKLQQVILIISSRIIKTEILSIYLNRRMLQNRTLQR